MGLVSRDMTQTLWNEVLIVLTKLVTPSNNFHIYYRDLLRLSNPVPISGP